jgi:tetratricopeptide (TPR) repeat protein
MKTKSELEQEVAKFDKVIKLSPNNHAAYNNKAKALAQLGNYDEALKCYNKAISLSEGKKPGYFVERGKLHVSMGQIESAIKDIEQAGKLPGDGTTEIYVKTTMKDVQKLRSLLEGIDKLVASGQMNKALADIMKNHIKVTAGNSVQIGAQNARIKDIEEVLSSVARKEDVSKALEKLDEKVEKQEVALRDGGVYDKAAIKQGFDSLNSILSYMLIVRHSTGLL